MHLPVIDAKTREANGEIGVKGASRAVRVR
jgi:hypothetical protein